ncbi:MAG: DUF4190 domain-containing protein [Acidimicrobiia bacterium]|nr:DUF4190 domain-containing protein [Acidimicrobiia bacterium]
MEPATALPPPPSPVGDAPPIQDTAFDGQPTSSTHATTALIVGIASLVFFGIVLGPLAIYLGGRAGNEIEESGGRLTGAQRAATARVLGFIGLILWTLLLIINLSVRS